MSYASKVGGWDCYMVKNMVINMVRNVVRNVCQYMGCILVTNNHIVTIKIGIALMPMPIFSIDERYLDLFAVFFVLHIISVF